MKRFKILAFISVLASCNSESQRPSIDYFGQEIPVSTPKIFAPGIISLNQRWEGNANFSPDGKEFFFNVFTDSMKDKAIYHSRYENKQWSAPTKLEVLDGYGNWEPFISYTGNELFFVSSRPPGNELWNGRIWRSKKNESNTWSIPELIKIEIETANGLWFPNHSRIDPNTLYFGGNLESIGTVGKGDLYYHNFENSTTVNLKSLNSNSEDWDPFISQDGSYLLWASDRPGGYGGTDLYVSFRSEGEWGDPINLGDKINSSKYEVAPRVSSDRKVLFFDRPENGTQDIYWISSSIIEEKRNIGD